MKSCLGKVQARGRVTLPVEIRRKVGAEPGDLVVFRPTGPTTVELRILPRLTLAEMLERFRIDEPVDLDALREAWQDDSLRDIVGCHAE